MDLNDRLADNASDTQPGPANAHQLAENFDLSSPCALLRETRERSRVSPRRILSTQAAVPVNRERTRNWSAAFRESAALRRRKRRDDARRCSRLPAIDPRGRGRNTPRNWRHSALIERSSSIVLLWNIEVEQQNVNESLVSRNDSRNDCYFPLSLYSHTRRVVPLSDILRK